jgi:hypothetical protein
VKPRSNQLVITRTTNFDIDYQHWYGVEGHAVMSEFHTWYAVTLTITVTLLGVQDGQLQVQVASTYAPQPIQNMNYVEPWGWLSTRTEGSASIWIAVYQTMDDVINNAVKAAMPEGLLPGIERIIKNALNLAPFVFPGGRQLFMANPAFNNEGDLLLGLQKKN